jgi:hypothetical protein
MNNKINHRKNDFDVEYKTNNMKRKKKGSNTLALVLLIVILSIILFSCAEEKDFVIDGNTVTVHPYGWANSGTSVPGVVYEPSFGNIVWSIVLIETVVAPIYFTGWKFMEPVSLEANYGYKPDPPQPLEVHKPKRRIKSKE